MSSRAIVSLGVWILAMVLVGTMTVGFALMFYVALTAFFAVVAAVLMLVTRQRQHQDGHRDEGEAAGHADLTGHGELSGHGG